METEVILSKNNVSGRVGVSVQCLATSSYPREGKFDFLFATAVSRPALDPTQSHIQDARETGLSIR